MTEYTDLHQVWVEDLVAAGLNRAQAERVVADAEWALRNRHQKEQ